MIALCLQHHQYAEADAFTVEQLRRLKERPFLADQHIRWRFDVWDQRRLALFAGSNWFFEPPYVLGVRDHVVVGLAQPQDTEPGGLNLDVRDQEGRVVLAMERNAWNLDVVPDDLVCRPRGNTLSVIREASGIALHIRFHSFTPHAMDRFLARLDVNKEDVLANVREWPVAVATLEATLRWPLPIVLAKVGTWGHRWLYKGSVFCGLGIRV